MFILMVVAGFSGAYIGLQGPTDIQLAAGFSIAATMFSVASILLQFRSQNIAIHKEEY
jgi:hypothetical protein